MGYIYGGNTGIKSAAELDRERMLVEALLGRKAAPKSLGEGLSALGDAIGYRVADRRLRADEGAANDAGNALFKSLFGGEKNVSDPAQPASYNTDPVEAPTAQPSFGDTFLPKVQSSTPAVAAEQAYDPNAQAQPIPQTMPQQVAQAEHPAPGTPQFDDLISKYEMVLGDPNFQHVDAARQKMAEQRYNQLLEMQQNASDPYKQQQLKNAQLEYDQKLHPDKVPLTALQQAQIGKLQAPDPSADEPKLIAGAIMNGDQPPDLTGLYKQGAHVRAELAKQGYNLTDAKEDWQAQQKYIATLNGPQQVRLRQAVDFAFHSLPIIKGLAQEWKAGNYPALNSVQLEAAKHGAMGQDAQRIATQLSSQIADMTSELGTVYKGGNSSTDESLRLAGENLKANWSEETLLAGIELVGKNLQIRRNSINSGSPMGAGTSYQQEVAPPPVAAALGGLPEGWTQEEFDVLTPDEQKELLGQ